jgi:mannosyltransferase
LFALCSLLGKRLPSSSAFRFFFNHPALKPYKYYWRVEPSIRFTCRIPYDPFLAMSQHKKVYGYNIALWEKGETAPSLFRKLSEYKAQLLYPTTGLWTAMMAPSYMLWPFRRLMSVIRNRDENGDLWNMCHFWSNFEIADMDFFRSEGYTRLFDYLDREGGFYYERWGDAPVHSLAVAMLLQPQEVHHFSDFGYVHGGLQYCAHESSAQARRGGHIIPGRMEEPDVEIGCDCTCEEGTRIVEPTCMNRIRSSLR